MNAWELLRLPLLEEQLSHVETALRQSVASDEPFLTEVAGHLVAAGGKRLRPALAVASALATGQECGPEVIQGAVAVELVHLGSLYHDDVIDEATSRRGVESVNARWGNLVAVLAGDFLLARASEIAASLGPEVAGLLATTIGRLCEGEISQLGACYSTRRSEPAYLSAIAGKTASLLATSARVGALVSGASRPAVEAMTEFGHAFGMAFQIWDDVRDLVATDEQLGKPAGNDLVEGTYTLPVLRALANPDVGEELAALLGRPLDAPERDKAREIILSTDAVATSIADARRWADQASEALHAGAAAATDGVPALMRATLAELAGRFLDELAIPDLDEAAAEDQPA
jgi:heptaprenyl diphosphate synthase